MEANTMRLIEQKQELSSHEKYVKTMKTAQKVACALKYINAGIGVYDAVKLAVILSTGTGNIATSAMGLALSVALVISASLVEKDCKEFTK